MSSAPNYDQIARDATQRLQSKFPEFTNEQLRAVVQEELTKLRSARVKDYLSVLTVRAAATRLAKMTMRD